MKSKLFLVSVLLFNLSLGLAQQPEFSMVGFATLDGGTTGGEGGQTVTPTTLEELKRYAEDPSTPYIIQLDREFTTGLKAYIEEGTGHIATSQSSTTIETTYGDIIKLGSNKTLIGVDDKAFLNRIGINAQCQSNIIIRNIKFTLQDVPIDKSGENKIVGIRNGVEILLGDPDCLSFQADSESLPKDQRISRHIWVDHCEFYNYPKSSEHKDRYDGLLDIKNDVQYVTISWCHFHDHSKACLFGKGDTDSFDRTTTLHHNYFENIKGSRLPLVRHGHHHYFNNYQYGCEDGLDVRKNSNVYVENCYFKETKNPVHGKLTDKGFATVVGSIFEACSRIPAGFVNIDNMAAKEAELNTPADFVPTSYYRYSHVLDDAEDVPELVKAYSGVGKLGSLTDIRPEITVSEKFLHMEGKVLKVHAEAGNLILIYGTDGRLVVSHKAVSSEETISMENYKGIYIVQVCDANKTRRQKIMI